MSNLVAPHLPPQSCNIEHHRKWQRIKILLAAAVFGLVAGMAGASMILGWIWPGFGGGDTWIMSRSVSSVSHDLLDDRVRVELEDRIGVVYRDLSTASGLSYLSQDKKIGEAFFVSSDGWMALYYPAYDGAYKNWRVFLKNGSSFNVQKVLRDSNSNLVYLKIAPSDQGAQFKVMNFGDSVKPLEDLFILNSNSWRHSSVISKTNHAFHLPHLDSAPSTAIEVNDNFEAGDIVVSTQGKMIGVISDSRFVLPSQYISGILPSILSAQKITYRTLGVQGWFSEEQPIIINNERTYGFAVARIFLDSSNLKAGDVILEIDGVVADSDNLWYNIIGNQSVKLKVLRKGKIIEINQDIKEI